MATVQGVLDKARLDLHDTPPVRWPDTELTSFANDFIQSAFGVRPDLFVGQFASLPGQLVVGSTFPLPARYEAQAAFYICMRAQKRDDQATIEGQVRLNHDLWVEGIKAS